MRPALVILSLTAGIAVFFATAQSSPAASTHAAEIERLQSHFDSVDTELRTRDVSSLTPAQRAKRALISGWLREYRDAAVFPKNDRFTGATPFFRDTEGTLCAMAYLIDRSGRGDIVDKVTATRNNAYIGELADDPVLIIWLDSAGLSVAEAARIQPTYNGDINFPDRTGVRGEFALAALGLSSVSLATSAVNVVKPRYLTGALGILVGAAAIVVGANHLDDNRVTERVAIATMALGGVSVASGIYGILESRNDDDDDDDRRKRDGRRPGRRRRASIFVAPGAVSGQDSPRVGLMMRSNF